MLAPAGKTLVEAARLGLTNTQRNLNACFAHPVHSVAGDGGVGVDGGGYNVAETRGDQGIGARAGSSRVVAGLQRYIGRAAEKAIAGVLGGYFEGNDFGVFHQVIFVPTLPGYLPGAVQNHTAHGGVWRADCDAAAGQFQCPLHPVPILIQSIHSIRGASSRILPERTLTGRSSARLRRRSGRVG